MGSTHRAAQSRIAAATAASKTAEAERDRRAREEQLRVGERLLGTDAQVEGQLGVASDAEQDYLGRYVVDTQLAAAIEGNSLGSIASGTVQANADRANDLLDQAQAAAREGNIDLANDLRAQAEQALTANNVINTAAANAPALESVFSLRTDPTQLAASQLSSPVARTVGGLVKQGREFLDPESETSQRFKSSLTTNAQREIAASERGALRQSRDIGLSRGAGRNPYAERAVDARTREGFAAQSAAVETEAARFFEGFSRAFAADTVGLAQSFLQNQSGIREEFQGALDNLALASADLANRAADRFEAARARAEADDQARKQFQRELIIQGIGLLSAAAGFAGAGGAGGGASSGTPSGGFIPGAGVGF